MGLKAAVIGDLHYPALSPHFEGAELRVRQSARDEFYLEILESFFSTDADIHVAVGDVTHEGRTEEWDEFLARAADVSRSHARLFRFVLGNHDTLFGDKATIEKRSGQTRYWVEDQGEVRLLFLDTTRETSPDNWGGTVGSEQLDWLHSLRELPKKPLLVFAHHPFPNTTSGSDETMMSVESSEELAQTFQAFSSHTVYCNGHNHVHSTVHRSPARESFSFVQAAAVFSLPSFRVLTLDRNQLRIETVELTDEKLRWQAERVRTGLPGYFHHREAAGASQDRVIELDLGSPLNQA